MRIVWTRFIPPPSPVAVIQDDQGTPVAVALNPLLARPLAAVLESLDGGLATTALAAARVDLAHHLARRLGLDEERVRDALEWATRRAGVEIIPDRILVHVSGGDDEKDVCRTGAGHRGGARPFDSEPEYRR